MNHINLLGIIQTTTTVSYGHGAVLATILNAVCRVLSRRGGVSLHIRQHIVYASRTDLDNFNDIIESLV